MGAFRASEIRSGLSNNSIVLRVTDNDSITKRTSDGYTALSDIVPSYVSLEYWRRYYQGLFPNWQCLSEHEADGLVEHITEGWSRYGRNRDSDWISTSASLAWTIWEIARRLDRNYRLDIELAVIRRKFHSGYRGAKPVRLDAADTLRLFYTRTDYDHPRVIDAIKFARASSEVVFYGRIFEKDVMDTSSWSIDVSQTRAIISREPVPDDRRKASLCPRNI